MRNHALREHYRRFGLRSNASVEQINAAFRRLSKDAHPDAGGSVAEFESLQQTRRVLLEARESDVGDAETEPRPVWMAGAFVGLPVAAAVGITGLVTLDRTLALVGLGVGAALFVVITVAVGVSRVHRANTSDAAVYPAAEEIIELRDPRPKRTAPVDRPVETQRPTAEAASVPVPPPIPDGLDQSAANSFSPVSSSASSRQPKI